MALKTTLLDAKDRLDALLTYANNATGQSDTNLGDAIEKLVEMANDHSIEDALITNAPMNEYYNDRVTTIGNISQRQYAFGATQIKKISFPNATACPSQYGFNGQNKSLLEELYLPKLETCGYGLAEENPYLRIIDFGKCFGGARCRDCPNLEVLILRDTSTKEVGSSWITGCTKILPSGSGGIVYVPQSLLASYQASSAWATNANVEFRAIEGSIYE